MKEDFKKDIKKLQEKLKSDSYAQAFYAALCNVKWVHKKTKEEYSCTWRFAGGLVAGIRNKGEDYLDFYCSGNEGAIRQDIYDDLQRIGWKPKAWPGDTIRVLNFSLDNTDII